MNRHKPSPGRLPAQTVPAIRVVPAERLAQGVSAPRNPTRRRFGRWAFLTLPALLLPAMTAAAPLADADARAVRQVVQAQLDAMAADDAERAFALASAGIQAQFGDAARFMSMVRSGYPMVVRPATVSFFQPQAEGPDRPAGAGADAMPDRAVQGVQLRDRAGRQWLASYLMERQRDGQWRIGGCVVVPDSGKSST